MPDLGRNKAVVRDFLQALAMGDLETLSSLLTDDYEHNISGLPRGRNALLAFAVGLQQAFCDLAMPIVNITAEDDWVAVSSLASGKHIGDFGPFKASGQYVEVKVAHFYRVADGLLAEHTEVADWSQLARQASSH
jgi:steroid delta-isomerase-like uncharacterized protein